MELAVVNGAGRWGRAERRGHLCNRLLSPVRRPRYQTNFFPQALRTARLSFLCSSVRNGSVITAAANRNVWETCFSSAISQVQRHRDLCVPDSIVFGGLSGETICNLLLWVATPAFCSSQFVLKVLQNTLRNLPDNGRWKKSASPTIKPSQKYRCITFRENQNVKSNLAFKFPLRPFIKS